MAVKSTCTSSVIRNLHDPMYRDFPLFDENMRIVKTSNCQVEQENMWWRKLTTGQVGRFKKRTGILEMLPMVVTTGLQMPRVPRGRCSGAVSRVSFNRTSDTSISLHYPKDSVPPPLHFSTFVNNKSPSYNLNINLFIVHQLEWFQQECYYCGTQLNVPAASREKG